MAKTIFEEPDSKLDAYLADIDRQARECFERLIEGMKQAQGIQAASS